MAVVLADRGLPDQLAGRAVHLIYVAHLAAADHDGSAFAASGDRRGLHVVVLEVIGDALVVPAQLPGGGVEVHVAVGVEIHRRVRDRRRGGLVRVADPVGHRPVATDQWRLPRSTGTDAK